VVSPAPRPSLGQSFTSESFIKTFLYLGAFFVIASALIFAAMIALVSTSLRLLVLAVVGLSFGGAALKIKKDMPQPSFIFWLIFAALSWISASTLADLLNLSGQPLSLFWLLAYFLLTLFFLFSVWLYRSRFYSLAAYLTLGLGALSFASFWPQPDTLIYPALGLVSLIALALTQLLKAWRGRAFSLPLFWLAQAGQAVLMFSSLIVSWVFLSEPTALHVWWPLLGLWALSTIFYLLSDWLSPLALFPFLQTGSLLLWPLLALKQFDAACVPLAWGHWGWGLALAAAGEAAARLPWQFTRRSARFWPLAALPLLLTGSTWPSFCNHPSLTVGLLALSTLAAGLMHLSRPRWWVWAAFLVFFQAGYLKAFTIPAWPLKNIAFISQQTLLLILLSLPDLLTRGPLPARLNWRWIQRLFVVLAAFVTLNAALVDFNQSLQSAPAFAVLGLVALGYALRLRRPWLTLATGSGLWLALAAALSDWSFEQVFPLLTAFLFAWALFGYALLRRWPRWSAPQRFGSLGWAAILSAFAAFAIQSTPAPLTYSLSAAALAWLFVLESFARTPALELVAYPMLALALWQALRGITPAHGQWLAQAMLMLGVETVFARLSRFPRPWRLLPLVVGGGLTALAVLINFSIPGNLSAWQASLALMVFFAALLALRRSPLLGYLGLAALAASVFFGLRLAGQTNWLTAQMSLAALFCLGGWAAFRAGVSARWSQVPLFSGLALSAAAALASPLEASGAFKALPLAVGATLWALEAFRRRNVWLGFPANGLYLLAYFTLLWELNVQQPQFFSVGAALLGLLMHYLLLRAGSSRGAFFTGLVSQLILQGVTYGQMLANNLYIYFFALFFQSLVVLFYGLLLRSRSLTFMPIVFIVLGVLTVVFGSLQDVTEILLLICCTGIVFILLGMSALRMREKFASLRSRLDDWRA